MKFFCFFVAFLLSSVFLVTNSLANDQQQNSAIPTKVQLVLPEPDDEHRQQLDQLFHEQKDGQDREQPQKCSFGQQFKRVLHGLEKKINLASKNF